MTLAKSHNLVVCQHFRRASPLKLLGQFHYISNSATRRVCIPILVMTSVDFSPLNSKGQGHFVTFVEGLLIRIFWSSFSLKQLSLNALLTIILALLPYVYKKSASSYKKQVSHCSPSAQWSGQDLMVLLLELKSSGRNMHNYS